MSQTLLTTQTPALVDLDDGSPYTMGTVFQADADGQILGVRVWASDNGWSGKTLTGLLYELDTQVQLATKDFSSVVAGAWNTVTFDTPVNITGGTWYLAARYINTNLYVATSHFFDTPLINGHLTSPADGAPRTNGRFLATGSAPAFPTNHFGGGCYFVDPIYELGGAGATIDISAALSAASGGSAALDRIGELAAALSAGAFLTADLAGSHINATSTAAVAARRTSSQTVAARRRSTPTVSDGG